MEDGYQTDRWNHTADLMAAIYRSQGMDVQPSDFHPKTMQKVAPKKTSYSAEFYAISLYGQKAIDMFKAHRAQLKASRSAPASS